MQFVVRLIVIFEAIFDERKKNLNCKIFGIFCLKFKPVEFLIRENIKNKLTSASNHDLKYKL
jgi:hypothetical protein